MLARGDPPANQEAPNSIGPDEVIVSARGGAHSKPLFSAAIVARSQTIFAKYNWLFLAGYEARVA